MIRVRTEITKKTPAQWSAEERKEFEGHVQKGAALLRDTEENIPDNIVRMVLEHHERPDGSGYPAGKKESELLGASKILILANMFDRLCSGEETGTELSPPAALAWLQENQPAGKEAGEILA